MLKKLALIFLTLFSAFSLLAADKIPIAIMDLQAIDVPDSTAKAVSDIMRTEIFNTGLFRVFERSEMEQILKEQQFGQTGLSDIDSAVKVGKLLSAKKVLVGTVSKLGSSYIVNARIIDVEKGEMEFADRAKSQSESDLDDAVATFAKNIAARIQNSISGKGQPPQNTYQKSTPENRSTSPGNSKLLAPAVIFGSAGLILGGLSAIFYFPVMNQDYNAYITAYNTDSASKGFSKVKADLTMSQIFVGAGGAMIVTSVILFIVKGKKSNASSMLDSNDGTKMAFASDHMTISYTKSW